MPVHQTVVTITHPDSIPLPTGTKCVRTINRTLYTIDELDDSARDKALNHFWSLNIDCDWWVHIYNDAATIGLEITGFDLGNRKSITGRLKESLRNCCALIRKNHGKDCDTFKTARQYLKGYAKAFAAWRTKEAKLFPAYYEGYSHSEWLAEFYDEELAEDFAKALLEDYLSMLQREHDFQTSEKQILESIRAGEYLFTENGQPAG